jgi:hypothetical protein
VVVPCSLTCNPTRTLPNQVSYLKESSMESFTLRPTRKIESVVAQQHHTCNGFRGNLISSTISQNNFSEHLWNSILNSWSSQCPGASIYRLRYRMGDCSDICGCRPESGHGPSGWTTMRQIFPRNSLRNLSCLRASFGRWDNVVRTVVHLLHVIST